MRLGNKMRSNLVRIVSIAGLCLAAAVGSAQLEAKLAESIKQLDKFDLGGALIVSSKLRPGESMNFTKRPTGRADEFLMTEESIAALGKLNGVESMHVFRQRKMEAVSDQMSPVEVRMLVVPPGFIAAHHLGESPLDDLLSRDCVLVPKGDGLNLDANAAPVTFRLPAAVRDKLIQIAKGGTGAIDDASFESKVCVREMKMPSGVASFERAVFISEDHSGLRDRTNFPQPLLWITVAKDPESAQTVKRIEHFVTTEATPASPQLELQVTRFGDYAATGINSDSLRAWQTRLRAAIWVVGVGLTLTAVLLQWGGMRRELALRSSLGQRKFVAISRVLRPWVVSLSFGMVLGLSLAMALSAVLGFNPLLVITSATDLGFVIFCSGFIFGMAMVAALNAEPMEVLSKNIT